MTIVNRPRVAAIGLDETQVTSIAPFCGVLRQFATLSDYRKNFDWTETDLVVSENLGTLALDSEAKSIDPKVNLLAFGVSSIAWSDVYSENFVYGMGVVEEYFEADTDIGNTERELTVNVADGNLYESLCQQFVRNSAKSGAPPKVVATTRHSQDPLIVTTSGKPVVLRIVLPRFTDKNEEAESQPIALLLPAVSNLTEWFRAFLTDVHQNDPARVPFAPPRLGEPGGWDTPREHELRNQIEDIRTHIAEQADKLDEIENELTAESVKADTEIRRALWADGDELTSVSLEILSGIGFQVRDMDAELNDGEAKREDLRLTLSSLPGWEAIVEVKGYPNDARTNDTRQIREYRERYRDENSNLPELTLWIANPHRKFEDPSARPMPTANVSEAAENIGAVYVEVPDLLRQYLLVEKGELDARTVIDSLVNAEPGLWVPPAPRTTD